MFEDPGWYAHPPLAVPCSSRGCRAIPAEDRLCTGRDAKMISTYGRWYRVCVYGHFTYPGNTSNTPWYWVHPDVRDHIWNNYFRDRKAPPPSDVHPPPRDPRKWPADYVLPEDYNWPPDPFYAPHQVPNYYIWPPPQAHPVFQENVFNPALAHQIAHANPGIAVAAVPQLQQEQWNQRVQVPIFHQRMRPAVGLMPAMDPIMPVHQMPSLGDTHHDAFPGQSISVPSSLAPPAVKQPLSLLTKPRVRANKHPLKMSLVCQAERCTVIAAVSCTTHRCKSCCIKIGGCTGLKSHNIRALAEMHKDKTEKRYGREQTYAEPMNPLYGKPIETTDTRKQIQEQRSRELNDKLKTAEFVKSQRECWIWGAEGADDDGSFKGLVLTDFVEGRGRVLWLNERRNAVMYAKVQHENLVKYYSDGNWLSHQLTNGPIPVPARMGRILLCLAFHSPPTNADHHLKSIDDADHIARPRSVPKTPARPRLATVPQTPSSLIKNMRIGDVDRMVQASALFEMEKTDDGEAFWINTAPSPKKLEPTHDNRPLWIRQPPAPTKHSKWPEMTEDMDNFMRPLQVHLIAADALRNAQEFHGEWVTTSKFYDVWWQYKVCQRKGLIDRYYGETFKRAINEVTQDDIRNEKLRSKKMKEEDEQKSPSKRRRLL